MQVLILGRAPRTKETLPDFLKWRRVTRPPLVFRGLTGSQRTPGFWGVTIMDFHDPYMQWYRHITLHFMTLPLYRDDMRYHTTTGTTQILVS